MNSWHTKVGVEEGQGGRAGLGSVVWMRVIMIFRYRTGEEIQKGDRILFHREPGRIELVASELGDPEIDWYIQQYGRGVVIIERVAGRTFIPADQIENCEDLEFVSRNDAL